MEQVPDISIISKGDNYFVRRDMSAKLMVIDEAFDVLE
jgi:hypothetical protein